MIAKFVDSHYEAVAGNFRGSRFPSRCYPYILIATAVTVVSRLRCEFRNFLQGPVLAPPAVGSSPIESILLAARYEGPAAGKSFTATSLPGHLLHFMLAGRVTQQCNGRTYQLTPGAVLWYHEDEWVQGIVQEAPWFYYSINFIAPTLPPPAFEARLFSALGPRAEASFAALVAAWNDKELSASSRLFRSHAALLDILDQLTTGEPQPIQYDAPAALWWKLESQVREDFSRPVGLKELEEWSGCSAATIARSSLAAVGLSPMRRIKQIRLSLARSLVQRSDLALGAIAQRVGYLRIHEFSRDYKRHFGSTPSSERRR